MAFELTPEQWQDVHRWQQQELDQLASDPDYARAAGAMPHYSRIGDWIVPEAGPRVLELGCGPGRYVALLASLGFDVVGADPCPAASLPTWQDINRHHPDVVFRDGVYAEDLPFADGEFDQVACLGALLYFKDPDRALAEMRRVLKPGGRMIMRTVNRRNLYRLMTGKNLDPAAPNAYSMTELCSLLERNGFTVREKFVYGFYPPIMTGRWWHLVNGRISLERQQLLSQLTPAPLRINLVAFCAAKPL